MRLTRIEIRNFRSIRHLVLDLGETTVLIGPNNVGKTAIVDAIRLVLTRRWGQCGTRFTQDDVRAASQERDPKDRQVSSITLRAEESAPGEWSVPEAQDLNPTLATDLSRGHQCFTLRTQFGRNEESDTFQQGLEILNIPGVHTVAPDTDQIEIQSFWRYLPVYYLGALRRAPEDRLSFPRFWEQHLEALEIPAGLESAAQHPLNNLFSRLRNGDSRVKSIMRALVLTNPAALRHADVPDLTLLPSETVDNYRWMEALIDPKELDDPWAMFHRQGLSAQSLSVMYLSKVFVKWLHNQMYGPKSSPVLLLEEPETHLSPQAARMLWRHVRTIPGQKIVTTHSPLSGDTEN